MEKPGLVVEVTYLAWRNLFGNPSYNSGYYAPAPRYGYVQPAPTCYAIQQGNQAWYNQADGRRYATVTATNRGQKGYRDDVVQQQVVCGSQYDDGYRTRRGEESQAQALQVLDLWR